MCKCILCLLFLDFVPLRVQYLNQNKPTANIRLHASVRLSNQHFFGQTDGHGNAKQNNSITLSSSKEVKPLKCASDRLPSLQRSSQHIRAKSSEHNLPPGAGVRGGRWLFMAKEMKPRLLTIACTARSASLHHLTSSLSYYQSITPLCFNIYRYYGFNGGLKKLESGAQRENSSSSQRKCSGQIQLSAPRYACS